MEAERATQATGFLTELFQASDPDRAQGEIATARDLLDQGAFQVRNAMNSTPALKAEMMVLLGDLYRRIGELDAAAPLLQEGLSLADAEGDTRLQVEARRALAIKEMDSGAHEVALALSEQGVQLLEQAGSIPGSLHASLMQPMLFSLAELGRTAEAVERGQAILDLVRASVALPETARYDYLYNVANVMLIAQQTDIAEALLLEAVEMDFEGIDRPSTQISLHTQLAGVLSHKGSLESALAHRYLALDLAEQIYPPEHFARARALSNLGSNLVALGRHQEAEAALSQSLEIYRKIYGDTKHPRVAAAQNNLARALQQADNFAAAEPHMIQVLELAEELFGKDDPRYAIAAGNLGVLYREMGEFDRAETILLENLELKRKIYGPEHFSIGNALLGISELRLRQGKPSAALELSEEALSLFSRIDYQSPPSIIMALNCNARALAALGRIDQARAEFDKALALGEESAADAGRAWPDLLAAHAEFLLSQYDPEAEVSLIRALEVYRKMLGENHPATLRLKSLLEE
jgi:serine/threonine-protein kinase